MKEDRTKKKYKLIENIMFCHKKLKEYMGIRYFIIAPLFIIISVAVPFLTAVLPSIVISVLLSGSNVGRIMLIVSVGTGALCICQYLFKKLDLETTN